MNYTMLFLNKIINFQKYFFNRINSFDVLLVSKKSDLQKTQMKLAPQEKIYGFSVKF